MAKYYWDINDLEKKLMLFEELLKKDTNNQLLIQDIKLLQSDIYNEYFKSNNKEKLLDIWKRIKERLQAIDFIRTPFDNFKNTDIDYILTPKLKSIKLSNGNILDLTHDFFKTLSKDLYNAFMIQFSKRKDHIRFDKKNSNFHGITNYYMYDKDAYITICSENDITDLITAIHEYMHATSLIVNPNHFLKEKCLFAEIDTMFIELLAEDFLNKVLQINDPIFLKYTTHLNKINNANLLSGIYRLMEYEKQIGTFKNNHDFKTAFFAHCDIKPGDVKHNLDYLDFDVTENYVLGYMYAIELYTIYKKDPENSLRLLKEIIQLENLSPIDFYQQLTNIGLNLNENLFKFQNNLYEETSLLIRR